VEIEHQPTFRPFDAVQPEPLNNIVPKAPFPNDPPWNSWAAIGVWALSVAFIVVIPSVFLVLYLVSRRISLNDQEQLKNFIFTDPGAIFAQLAPVLLAHLLTIAIAWAVVTRFNIYSFRKTLGWEKAGFAWWHYCIILVGFFVVATIVTSILPEQENDFFRILKNSRTAVYIVAIFATFTAPLVEEVVYRGLLYSAFQRAFGVPAAFVLATVLFSIVHIPQYWPSYSTIFLLTLLSVTLTAIRVKTNNLLPCIILHTLFNGLQSILLILEPYLEPYMKTPEVPDPIGTILAILK
jgi:membrane protease YdiL (CAAX protease family)